MLRRLPKILIHYIIGATFAGILYLCLALFGMFISFWKLHLIIVIFHLFFYIITANHGWWTLLSIGLNLILINASYLPFYILQNNGEVEYFGPPYYPLIFFPVSFFSFVNVIIIWAIWTTNKLLIDLWFRRFKTVHYHESIADMLIRPTPL